MEDNEIVAESKDKKVVYNKKQVYIAMLIPIIGWIYIGVGLIFPSLLQIHWIFFIIWIIDIFLSVVVHGAQLYISIPAGKKEKISIWKIVLYTMLFGATWWKPLRDGVLTNLKKE